MESALDLADNWWGLTRLDPHVFVDNSAAISPCRKFRFQIEGTHGQFVLRGGEYVEAYFMARLRLRPTPGNASPYQEV